MKETLAGLGIAGLLCIPCLLVLGGGALAVSGAATLALAGNPAVQGLALLALVAGLAVGWRYVARRRACATDCAAQESDPVESPSGRTANGVRPGERTADAAAAASERTRR